MAGSMAAGAQAGAAFGPYGAAIGAGLGAVADIAGSGSSGGPFMGGNASQAAYGTGLDGSGWVINFGGQQTATTTSAKTPDAPDAYSASHATVMGVPQQYLVYGAIALAALLLIRKRKGA